MFTIFLVSTAAAISALLGGLLLRGRPDAAPATVSGSAVAVAVLTVALAALGVWML